MNVEIINPFVAAASNVFATMLSTQIKRGELQAKGEYCPEYEISGIVGLTGQITGTVLLSLSRDLALSATMTLLGDRPDDFSPDVIDTVGELTNMIAGSAKGQLQHYDLNLGLPTVIIGGEGLVQFPSKITPICIPFSTEIGSFSVDIGFSEA